MRNFITFFHRNVLEQNVNEIASLYESSWNKLTDRFFQDGPWPPASVVAPLVNDGEDGSPPPFRGTRTLTRRRRPAQTPCS